MSVYVAQTGPAFVALFAGWAILWGVRDRVGPVTYHLGAAPAGLVAFAAAAAISTLAGIGFGPPVIAGTVLLLAVLVHLLARYEGDRSDPRSPVPAYGFVLTAAVVALAGGVVTFVGITIATNDALVWYWPMSLELAREGAYSSAVFSTRGSLIPAFGAVHVLAGADWAYVAYPLVAVNLLALLGLSLRRMARSLRLTGLLAWLPAAGAAGFLALEPSFIFHAFFVHSHMLSALYLLIAVIALWDVRSSDGRADETGGAAHGADSGVGGLVVAGLATAGLALVRPDGIAYGMVVVAAAVAVLTRPSRASRGNVAYFATSAGVVALVYLASIARLGLWESTKLSGPLALAVLSVLCGSALLPGAIRLLAEKTRVDLRSERFLVFAIGVALAVHVLLAVATPDSLLLSLANGAVNLFGGGGGYGPVWHLLLAALVLSVLTRDAVDVRAPRASVFMTIVLFMLVSSVVHAATHPGRIGDLDSFTRVAFHVIPLSVWYAGTIITRILCDDGHAHA